MTTAALTDRSDAATPAVGAPHDRRVVRGAAAEPKRPLLRYHGGKWRLAPWILNHLPTHRTYVEPFGGGASVLLQKPRSYAEVYNDLDGEVVNLFRVVRERGEELAQACELTPFARAEFEQAYEDGGSDLERARRTLVRSFMSFGSAGVTKQATGFRANTTRAYTTPATDWMRYPDHLRALIQRLRGVVIEQRDALDVMKAHDGDDTVHYVDPPYVHDTRHHRTRAPAYRHELTDDQHRALASALHELRGMVVLSGYRCPLYDELFADWRRVDVSTHADGAKDRTESLWMSSRCPQSGLFDTHTAKLTCPPRAGHRSDDEQGNDCGAGCRGGSS